jgi:protein-S-isoprenylcysteine O-methyltransferase Ste14
VTPRGSVYAAVRTDGRRPGFSCSVTMRLTLERRRAEFLDMRRLRPSVRHFRRSIVSPLVTLLVLGIVSVSVPAFAGQSAAADVPSRSRPIAATVLPVRLRLVTHRTPRPEPGPIERSIAVEARRLALTSAATQSSGNVNSVHQRSWAGRHPILLGTLTGLGFGLADDVTECVAGVEIVPHSDGGLPCDLRVGTAVAGLSAGIGAGIGAVVALFFR